MISLAPRAVSDAGAASPGARSASTLPKKFALSTKVRKLPLFWQSRDLKCDITCPRQGPTYVLDKSVTCCLHLPPAAAARTEFSTYAWLVAIASRRNNADP